MLKFTSSEGPEIQWIPHSGASSRFPCCVFLGQPGPRQLVRAVGIGSLPGHWAPLLSELPVRLLPARTAGSGAEPRCGWQVTLSREGSAKDEGEYISSTTSVGEMSPEKSDGGSVRWSGVRRGTDERPRGAAGHCGVSRGHGVRARVSAERAAGGAAGLVLCDVTLPLPLLHTGGWLAWLVHPWAPLGASREETAEEAGSLPAPSGGPSHSSAPTGREKWGSFLPPKTLIKRGCCCVWLCNETSAQGQVGKWENVESAVEDGEVSSLGRNLRGTALIQIELLKMSPSSCHLIFLSPPLPRTNIFQIFISQEMLPGPPSPSSLLSSMWVFWQITTYSSAGKPSSFHVIFSLQRLAAGKPWLKLLR